MLHRTRLPILIFQKRYSLKHRNLKLFREKSRMILNTFRMRESQIDEI